MTNNDLLNTDTNELINSSETYIQLSKGLIGLCVVVIMILSTYTSTLITERKALQSQNDSLKSSNRSLSDNLLIPR